MDIRELLATLRSRWLVVVACAIIGGLVALAISLLTTPVYAATTQLYVTSSGGDSTAAAYQGNVAAQQRVQSYAQLVKSREITDKVVSDPRVTVSSGQLKGQITATAAPNTVLLNVSVHDTDPQRAQLLANKVGESLSEFIRFLETPAGGGEPLAKLSIVSPAEVPSEAEKPNTLGNVALGLAAGLVVGVALAVLLARLDRRVRSKELVEKLTCRPEVGAIPFNRKREQRAQVPFREGHSPEAEAYRRLRTNLQFLNVDNPPRALVLTSSMPGEGKSTTALNLGLALAEAGNKVVLVEADLRRPRVAKYMGLNEKIGLTSVLTGQAGVEDVLQEAQSDGLDLLGCGPIPPNPSELLGSQAAAHLIDELRTRYDYVIIDSPPVLPVTDASILAQHADGVLLVVQYNKTTVEQVERSVASLGQVDASILGTILTMTKAQSKRHMYYYEGYYEPDSEKTSRRASRTKSVSTADEE